MHCFMISICDADSQHKKLLLLKTPQNTKNSIKYCYHWEKKAISLTGVFPGKLIDFTNEASIRRSFVKNSFVDGGDIHF